MSSCTKDEVTDVVRELENGKASDIPISLMKKTSLSEFIIFTATK